MAFKKILTTVFIILIATGFGYSQGQSLQQKFESVSEKLMFKPESQIPSFIVFKPESQPVFEIAFETWFKKQMGEEETFGLQLLSAEDDQIGYTHYRYQQLYNNLLVENTMYLVHVKDGKIVSMNGLLYHHFNPSSSKSITEVEALQKALLYTNAKTYMWEDKTSELLIKAQQKDEFATWYPSAKLVYISKDYHTIASEYKLVYKFDIYATEPMSRQYIYVDADKAEVIAHIDRIHTSDTPVTAKTAMSGDQRIVADYYAANSFRLREKKRGNGSGIETYNMQTGTSYGSAVDFTDSDTTWNNVNSYYDEYATDAHFGAEMTYDYYKKIYNRNSIDNSGLKLVSYVHYYTNYSNAFWDGSRMTYGDGNGGSTKPLVSLDIAGHEITHGLTSYTANLNYSYESGALNESFSDCLGTAIEWFGDSGKFEWDLATKIGWTIRSMGNPKAHSQPDTYLGQKWYTGASDNGGVHTNSGVQNYWFYLLSTGDTGTNDNGDYYSVDSIGIWKTAAIAYRTLTYYLSSSSQYADARIYSIKAAEDLFGSCSNEVFAVAAAWHAVGIGAELSHNTTVVLQQNIQTIVPASTNNVILGITVTPACNQQDTLFSLTFNTNGCSRVADIKNAKLWYTGTSSTFAATTQYGSTKTSPSGSFTFSGSQKLTKNADQYFWLTYDIDTNATLGDTLDAECTSAKVDTIITPAITAPAGYCRINNCIPPTSYSPCSFMYISNVVLDNINNSSGCSSTSYTDYSNQSTTVTQGDQVNYSISLYGYNMYVCIWVDLNNNGAFDSAEVLVKNQLSSSYIASGTFTIPSATSIGSHAVRVTADYYTTYNGTACGKLYYGESEDYTIKVDSAKSMYYISSNTSQNTNPIQKNTTNNHIIGIKVVMGGAGNAIPMKSFNLNTKGTTDTADITNAKLWYTGTTGTFATTTQFGKTIIYPGNNFRVSDSVILSKGTNYFWLTYDITNNPKKGNYIDASCDSLTLGYSTYIPDTVNPTGNRQFAYCIPPTSVTACTYMYISNVKLDSINKTSGCSSTSYSDFTSNSTTTSQNKSVSYTVSSYQYDQYVSIWVDYDNSGSFDSLEEVVKNKQTSNLKTTGTFTIPSSAPAGKHQVRIMADYNSFPASSVCSQLNYGETEDYTINIFPAPPNPVLSPNSIVNFCMGNGQLFTTGYDSNYTYYWYKNSTTLLSSGKGHPYDSLYYSPSSAGNDTITVNVMDSYGQTTASGKVIVKISPIPVAGTASASAATICKGNFVNLSLSGSTGTINWQYYNGSVWTNLGSAANPYKAYPTSNIIYRAYISSGACGNDSSNQVSVSIDPNSVAGSVSPSSASLCIGDSVKLGISGNTGSINWQYYNNGTWQNSGDTSTGFYIKPNSSIIYRAVVKSGICGVDSSKNITVTVNPKPVGGTASLSATTLCAGDSVSLSLANSTGTINWQYYNGSVWTNLGSSTNPYKIRPTSNNTYRAYITSGACGSDSSNQVSVTVVPKSVAGSVSPSSASICIGDSVKLSITGNTGTINWQYYSNNVWQNSGDTSTSFYIIPNSSIIYRAMVTSGICGADSSKNISVTVSPKSVGGSASLSANSICAGDSVSMSVSNNTGSIVWQYYNNNVWTNMGSSKNPYKILPLASNIYRAYITSGACASDSSNQVSLTVNPKAVAGSISISTSFICAGDSVNLTLSNNKGTIDWQYNTGSAWQSLGLTNNNVYVKPTTITNYRAKVTAGSCGSDSTKVVTVIVTALPVAGSISATKNTLCPGDTSQLSITGNTGSITWQYYNGAVWQFLGSSANNIYVLPTSNTSYRTLVNSGNCGTDTSKIIAITVNPKAVAGIAVSVVSAICPGDSTNITLTGNTGNINWKYYNNNTWSSTGDTTNSITVSPTAKTDYRAYISTVCSIDSSKIISIDIYPAAIATITPGGPKTLCDGDSITLVANQSASYKWNTGETTQKVTIKTTNTLSVSIIDLHGCKASSTSNTYTFNNPATPTLSKHGDTLFALPAGAASYTWEYKGSIITTTFVNYILPTQKGMYALRLKDSGGCISALSQLYNFNFDGVANIYNTNSSIQVWPNPSDGIYNIIASVGNNQRTSLKVTDMTGRLLLLENHNTTNGTLSTIVDLSGFSHGIYLLYIDGENGMSVPVKLVRE